MWQWVIVHLVKKCSIWKEIWCLEKLCKTSLVFTINVSVSSPTWFNAVITNGTRPGTWVGNYSSCSSGDTCLNFTGAETKPAVCQLTFLQDRRGVVYPRNKRMSQRCWNWFWKRRNRKIESTELNTLLLCTEDCDSALNSRNVFDPWTWDALGDALWGQAMRRDRVLAEFLCLWQTVFKAHVAPGNLRKKTRLVPPWQSCWPPLCPHWAKHRSLIISLSWLWEDNHDDPCSPCPFERNLKGSLIVPPANPICMISGQRWENKLPQRGMQIYCMLFQSFINSTSDLDGKACFMVS